MQFRKILRKGTVYNFYWFERGGGRIYLGQITSGSHLWYKIQDFEQKIRLNDGDDDFSVLAGTGGGGLLAGVLLVWIAGKW